MFLSGPGGSARFAALLVADYVHTLRRKFHESFNKMFKYFYSVINILNTDNACYGPSPPNLTENNTISNNIVRYMKVSKTGSEKMKFHETYTPIIYTA